MGVDIRQYFILGIQLPKDIFSADGFYDKFESYINDEEDYEIVYDSMSEDYAIFGKVIIRRDADDDPNIFDDIHIDVDEKQKIKVKAKELFGVDIEPKYIAFTHYF